MHNKTDASPLLKLAGVHTHIGEYHILQGVDFEVPRSGITVLLGRNGAGKTTTLRTIMGLWQASAGVVNFDGQDISRTRTPDIARQGISFVPEDMGIFAGLTVQENLSLAVMGDRMDEARLEWIFGFFPALKRFWLRPGGTLSGGQKQMVAIARAIVADPTFLLCDEPTGDLDRKSADEIMDLVERLVKEHGKTVLMVTHDPRAAQRAHGVLHLDKGALTEGGRDSV